ncbi:hypothetical protein LCGC14_2352610 [marine sediment metagenome]|uniref:Uncharacterized protein n=1 Tax=marine sediment metagenome TaxID=412755 RepID=A0A0F9C8R1_9ZZZZ
MFGLLRSWWGIPSLNMKALWAVIAGLVGLCVLYTFIFLAYVGVLAYEVLGEVGLW